MFASKVKINIFMTFFLSDRIFGVNKKCQKTLISATIGGILCSHFLLQHFFHIQLTVRGTKIRRGKYN